MNAYSGRPITKQEVGLISLLAIGGTAISFFIFDFYDTSLIAAKCSFLFLSASISLLLFYQLLVGFNVPVGNRLAGSFWGSLPWNSIQLWQFPYIGFLFIPLEIICSGVIVSFRTGIVVWKAVIASLVVRLVVLGVYYSLRIEIIHLLLGKH